MTARRPPDISYDIPTPGTRSEDQFQTTLHNLNEADWEDEEAETLQQPANPRSLRAARELPDEAAVPVIHPALTNYGPESVATFLRQAREIHLPGPTTSLSPRPTDRYARTQGAFSLRSGRSCNQNSSAGWPYASFSEDPDRSDLSDADDHVLSETRLTSFRDRRKPRRSNSEELLGKDENQAPSRKRGLKRARRTFNRKKTNQEEDAAAAQPYSAPHGTALPYSLSLNRAGLFDFDERNDSSLNIRDAGEIRRQPTHSDIFPRATLSISIASFDRADNWLPTKREETEMEGDNGVGSADSSRRDRHTELRSSGAQQRLSQMPRAQKSRASFDSRRSGFRSPLHSTRAPSAKSLRHNHVRPFLEPGDDEPRSYDSDSMSSREDFGLRPSLMTTRPNKSQMPARNRRTSVEHHQNEDTTLYSWDKQMDSTAIKRHQPRLSPPPVSNAPHSHLFAPTQSTFNNERSSRENLLDDLSSRAACPSAQRASLRPVGETDAAMFGTSTSRHSALDRHCVQANNEHHLADNYISPAPGKVSTHLQAPIATRLVSTSLNPEYQPGSLSASSQHPPLCQAKDSSCRWPALPTEIYLEIAVYLSRDDALNLRLVCRDFSIAMMGAVFGSVVVPFGRAMFDTSFTNCDRNPPFSSMFEKYGLAIRKFGISFEADSDLVAMAQMKTISNEESSWWGNYSWPTPAYPRFNELYVLENLADNVSLLKSAMGHLGKTHELGLSIDSGHGWLNGPDISDMALFEARCGQRTRVFGKNLPARDKQKNAIQAQLFESAQSKTLRECIESLRLHRRLFGPEDVALLRSIAIRNLESFTSVIRQPDFDAAAHTGGTDPTRSPAFNVGQHANPGQPHLGGAHQPPNGGMNASLHHGVGNQFLQPMPGHAQNNAAVNPYYYQHNVPPPQPVISQVGPLSAPAALPNVAVINLPHGDYSYPQTTLHGNRKLSGSRKVPKEKRKIQPQFPLIFNGYNLSAEVGGCSQLIQKKVASPKSFPLQPGTLTEAQAQWLMETVWAQRAFLSAYTTSVLANKACFAQVHSLHIAKISSGLLSSLEQRQLWQGLPGLIALTVLVSPDWRAEHITGDQNFNSNMAVSPVDASLQLAAFLTTYIAPLERLSILKIGFVGGGENATGIMARNRHVLPAPISSAPRMWLSDHVAEPSPSTIATFNHIKHLTITNAWLSPLMLEAFMTKSQDTSLRRLTLLSVSLTATHGQRLAGPLTTATETLDPIHPPSMWLHESLPTTHCWPATMDRITPGATFLDRKYDAGMIDDIWANPRPRPSFRGFVSRLEFISCGYVHISGLSVQELNQYDLVYPNSDPMDAGLKERAAVLAEKGVMLSDKNPSTGADWPLLGNLTQCIHPIEKRVLEKAWGMRFGWGNHLERWAAVEDGCFEGGTGRFSGCIVGEGGKGIGAGET